MEELVRHTSSTDIVAQTVKVPATKIHLLDIHSSTKNLFVKYVNYTITF